MAVFRSLAGCQPQPLRPDLILNLHFLSSMLMFMLVLTLVLTSTLTLTLTVFAIAAASRYRHCSPTSVQESALCMALIIGMVIGAFFFLHEGFQLLECIRSKPACVFQHGRWPWWLLLGWPLAYSVRLHRQMCFRAMSVDFCVSLALKDFGGSAASPSKTCAGGLCERE